MLTIIIGYKVLLLSSVG